MEKTTRHTLSLMFSLLLMGCGNPSPDTSATTHHTVNANVFTTQTGEINVTAAYPGSVVAEQQAQIASRMMGYVRHINVEAGQRVKKGDLLITVDPTDVQGQVAMSAASLAQADAALADAKSDYDRFGTLYRDEAIPKAQWDKIRLQYAVAQQQENAARAGHNTASAQLAYATIRAPFSGLITQRLISVGGLATPGQTLLSMVNPEQLDIETQVSENTYSQLQLNENVKLRINQTTLTGKIIEIVAAADPITHTHLVKITPSANAILQSGMFAQIDFNIGQRLGLRIPSSAIIERAGITGVFIMDTKHIAHFRMVRTGDSIGNQTVIDAGLNSGEQVINQPDSGLQSGDTIELGTGNV